MQFSQTSVHESNRSRLFHEWSNGKVFPAWGVIKWRKSINNLLRATELTIWMVSILRSRAPTESFPPSYHLNHPPLSVSMLSLAWLAPLWRSWFCWWRKPLASLRRTANPPPRLSRPPIYSQTCSRRARSFVVQQSPPESSTWSWWELGGSALRGWCGGPSPVARPARIHKSFELRRLVAARMGGRWWRERGGQEERAESRQSDCGITSLWPTSLRSALNASIWKQPNYYWPLHPLKKHSSND